MGADLILKDTPALLEILINSPYTLGRDSLSDSEGSSELIVEVFASLRTTLGKVNYYVEIQHGLCLYVYLLRGQKHQWDFTRCLLS